MAKSPDTIRVTNDALVKLLEDTGKRLIEGAMSLRDGFDVPVKYAKPERHESWYDAELNEVWALIDGKGYERPHIRSGGGWRTFGRNMKIFPQEHFVAGELLWKPKPARYRVFCGNPTHQAAVISWPIEASFATPEEAIASVPRQWSPNDHPRVVKFAPPIPLSAGSGTEKP